MTEGASRASRETSTGTWLREATSLPAPAAGDRPSGRRCSPGTATRGQAAPGSTPCAAGRAAPGGHLGCQMPKCQQAGGSSQQQVFCREAPPVSPQAAGTSRGRRGGWGLDCVRFTFLGVSIKAREDNSWNIKRDVGKFPKDPSCELRPWEWPRRRRFWVTAPSGSVPTSDGEETPRCQDDNERAGSRGARPPTPGDALHDWAAVAARRARLARRSKWGEESVSVRDPASPQEVAGHSEADRPAGSRARRPCEAFTETATCQGLRGSSRERVQSK